MKDFNPVLEKDAEDFLSQICDGDARIALNILEFAIKTEKEKSGKRIISAFTIASTGDMLSFLPISSIELIRGVPFSLHATSGKCLTQSASIFSFIPGSFPRTITSTASPKAFQDTSAFVWITEICGSIKGLGAVSIVISGLIMALFSSTSMFAVIDIFIRLMNHI